MTEPSDRVGFIAGLGSPYAVSLPGLAISSSLILLASVVGSPADWSGQLLPKFAAVAIGLAIAVMVILVGKRLIPGRGNGHGWLVLLLFVVAGLAFSTAMGPIEVALGIAKAPDFEWRIPLGTPLATIFLCLGAIQADAWLRHRDRLTAIASRRAQLETARDRTAMRVQAWRTEVADRVRSSVDEVMQDLPTSDDEGVVNQLRHLAYDVIRPMSHEVATGPLDDGPTLRASQPRRKVVGLWTATSSVGVPLVAYPVTMGLLCSILGIGLFGLVPGLLYAGCFAVSSAGAASMSRLVARAGTSASLRLLAMALIVAVFAAVGTAAGLDFAEPTRWVTSVWLASPIALVVAAILAVDAGVQSRRRDLERSLDEVNEQLAWALARANGEFYLQRRALTRWIHGDLQAAINAAAISIDRARRQGHPAQGAVSDGIALIARAIEEIPEAPAPELANVFENITQTWRGTCEITWKVDPEALTRASAQPAGAAAIADIVVEAVANAVRHGKASRAIVVIAIEDDTAIITVADDGMPTTNEPGLGSQIMNEVCLDWSREPGARGGTELHARIPLAALGTHTDGELDLGR